MAAYIGPFMIALLGTVCLTWMSFGPDEQSRQIALLFPPWQTDGFSRALGTGLAIVDIHWQGHVVVVETAGNPTALAALERQGFWLLDATGSITCESLKQRI